MKIKIYAEVQGSKNANEKKIINVNTRHGEMPYKLGSSMEEFHSSNLCGNNSCGLVLVLVDDNHISGKIYLFIFLFSNMHYDQ